MLLPTPKSIGLDCDTIPGSEGNCTCASPRAGACAAALSWSRAVGCALSRPASSGWRSSEGRCVCYWAYGAIEARMCANSEIVLGGGGQLWPGHAAVFSSLSFLVLQHETRKGPTLLCAGGLAASFAAKKPYRPHRRHAQHRLWGHTSSTELHGEAPTV